MPLCPMCKEAERHKTPSQTLSYCKPCYLAWQQARRSAVKVKPSQIQEIWLNVPHAVKRAARIKLGNALARGLVHKPKECSSCRCSGEVEAHHPNYSKPLDVVWLCKQCHIKEHTYGEPEQTS